MARCCQARRGHQAIHGWPGPSADGLGPRLAPNNKDEFAKQSQVLSYASEWMNEWAEIDMPLARVLYKMVSCCCVGYCIETNEYDA